MAISSFSKFLHRLKESVGTDKINGFEIMSLDDFLADKSNYKAGKPLDEEDYPLTFRRPSSPEKGSGPLTGFHSQRVSDAELAQNAEIRRTTPDLSTLVRKRESLKKQIEKIKEKNPTKAQELQKQKDVLDQQWRDRSRVQMKTPAVHKSTFQATEPGKDTNIKFVNPDKGDIEYDPERLRASIMEKPRQILRRNQKIEHSGGKFDIMYNIGLPALKGLIVDEHAPGKPFVIVDTCPGAGECALTCYALKGNYVRVPQAGLALSKVLNFVVNYPQEFKQATIKEIEKAKKYANKNNIENVYVRWHDAGDFFSPEYLKIAYDIAKEFPDINFYAYTKMGSVHVGSNKPDNFITNFSIGAKPQELIRVKQLMDKYGKDLFSKYGKNSVTVPYDLFKDLYPRTPKGKRVKDANGKFIFKDEASKDMFRERLSKEFHIPNDETLVSYAEMMKLPSGNEPKYNVYVAPGDGDDSAHRKDVKGTFLLFH